MGDEDEEDEGEREREQREAEGFNREVERGHEASGCLSYPVNLLLLSPVMELHPCAACIRSPNPLTLPRQDKLKR